MRSPHQDTHVLVFLLVLGVLNVAADRPPNTLARGTVLKMDRSVENQIFKLPPNQLIEVHGKPMTVADIRVRILAKRKRAGAARAASAKVSSQRLAALEAKFQKDQQAKLETENAKVGAELARLARRQHSALRNSRLQAIRQEALEIQRRYPSASLAQKAKDDARAQALSEEYQKLAW